MPDASRVSDRLDAVHRSVPWQLVLRDLGATFVWVVAVSLLFRATGWPTWPYVVTVFAGVLIYSLLADPWTTAPDD
ncbi:hypothetical protein [Halorarum halobium]|uniref:hypothetical protein n=1 Tax=Halorarum halobium TaxID=3075121 RepID=UPI0028A8F035|nr:hypothetical protein [Halobaculum sp. XH14]